VTLLLRFDATVLITIWLVVTGAGSLAVYSGRQAFSLIPAGMFLLRIALMCAGFFPEAFKARRVLTDGFSDPGITSQPVGM
jgi:hypothetical protein